MSTSVAEPQPAVRTDAGDACIGAAGAVAVLPRSAVLSQWLLPNPLVGSAIGLVAGIWLDSRLVVPVWLGVGVFVVAGLWIWRSRAVLTGHLGLLMAAVAVGAVLHDTSFRRWPVDHVARYADLEGQAIRLSGTIVSSPVVREGGSSGVAWYPQLPRTRFLLATDSAGGSADGSAGGQPVSGLVSVVVREPALDVVAGDRVEIFGTLRLSRPPANPGGRNFALANQRNGVLVELNCRRAGEVRIVKSDPWKWRTCRDRLRQRARAAMLEGTYPEDVPDSGLLAGMVLGQRSAIDAEINEAFVRSGTVHYLCVSGAHVGMLVGAVWALGWLLGANRRQCAGWTMLAATSYAILAESNAPIVRAAIMTDLACLAMLSRKPVRPANCLAISALILLVIRPTQVFHAGFQFSYITLLSIIYVSPRLYHSCTRVYRRLAGTDDPLLAPEMQQRLGMRSPRWAYVDKAVRRVGRLLSVGISAALVGAMLSAFHFHQVQCWGWINTIVLMPLIWMIMVLGMLKTLASVVAPFFSGLLGWPLAVLTDGLIDLTEIMSGLPAASVATPDVPTWLVALGLGVVLLWTLQPALRIPRPWSRVAGLGFAVVAACTLAPPGPQRGMTVFVLAVGNGSTTVIELPNGKTVLYDVGCSPPYDLERWTLGPLLSRQRCYKADSVILSHADLDHYAGLEALIARRRIAQIITTPHFRREGQQQWTSRQLMAQVDEKQIPWREACRGDRLTGTGEAVLEVLWPPADYPDTSDSNENSLVLRISYAGRSVLACGDIEENAIRQLLATTDLTADVLLLPHHGAVTPSTAAFVRAVDPEYCIRSTGRRQTSDALRQAIADRRYYSTAECGAIRVTVDPHGLAVLPRFEPPH